jgi:hypothetical protein
MVALCPTSSNTDSTNEAASNHSESRWQAELVSCSAYSSTLKMKAIRSSKTSVDFQCTTWQYIPTGCTSNPTKRVLVSRGHALHKVYIFKKETIPIHKNKDTESE